jgi:hypothetical protein
MPLRCDDAGMPRGLRFSVHPDLEVDARVRRFRRVLRERGLAWQTVLYERTG